MMFTSLTRSVDDERAGLELSAPQQDVAANLMALSDDRAYKHCVPYAEEWL